MKKSFRSSSSKSSPRPASRPSGASRPKESFSRPKEVSRPMKESGPNSAGVNFGNDRSKESFGPGGGFSGNKENYSGNQPFMPRQSGWRRRRTPLIVTIVLVVLCCLLILCIAGAIVLVNQGIISVPNY